MFYILGRERVVHILNQVWEFMVCIAQHKDNHKALSFAFECITNT